MPKHAGCYSTLPSSCENDRAAVRLSLSSDLLVIVADAVGILVEEGPATAPTDTASCRLTRPPAGTAGRPPSGATPVPGTSAVPGTSPVACPAAVACPASPSGRLAVARAASLSGSPAIAWASRPCRRHCVPRRADARRRRTWLRWATGAIHRTRGTLQPEGTEDVIAEPDRLAVERERFGWNHAQAGARLARSWSLPDTFAMLIEHHAMYEDLTRTGGSPGQLVVALSALLPSVQDQDWFERDQLVASFCQLTHSSTSDLLSLLDEVDKSFNEFAPVLKLGMPERSLVERLQPEEATVL